MSAAPGPVSPGETAVELHGIGKRFPGVVANHDVELTVRRGTVHAVVGENGAGKSTLMKILYGMQPPDEGTITINGETVRLGSPAEAIAHEIGMVHQHFMLAGNLTVLENVVLGAEKAHGIGAAARRRIMEISEQYGLDVQPDRLVAEQGVGQLQRVEILKVLYRGARTLILDEPTAVLVPQEVDKLFGNLRKLKREGLTVIFISHKLDEVLSVADEITVMRQGTTVASVDPTQTTARELATLMVGGELPVPELRESTVTDRAMLDVANLTVRTDDGRPVVDDVSFTIHEGEILGIAGVEGNGQAELIEALIGVRKPETGSIRLGEEDIASWPTRRRREAGIGYIPEDRQRQGLLLNSSLWENRILGHQGEFDSGGFLRLGRARADTARIVEAYDVRTPGIHVDADALSGGNQQKLIVGREMSGSPRVLIAGHPTRGVDVGAQAAIWEHLRQARAEGLAVLLISADLDELIGMSDTLRVIYRGRLVAQLDPSACRPEDLGSAMTGAGGNGQTPAAEDDTGGTGGDDEGRGTGEGKDA